jgi:hypothetical protein
MLATIRFLSQTLARSAGEGIKKPLLALRAGVFFKHLGATKKPHRLSLQEPARLVFR